MTNGDKLRQMTDEELAEFLLESRSRCKLCKNEMKSVKVHTMNAGKGLMIGSNRR